MNSVSGWLPWGCGWACWCLLRLSGVLTLAGKGGDPIQGQGKPPGITSVCCQCKFWQIFKVKRRFFFFQGGRKSKFKAVNCQL